MKGNTDMKTIMVVDDDQDLRRLLGYHLEKHGYSVVEAQDGDEAITMITDLHGQGKEPALVILDIMMPGLDGFETCRLLKENEWLCGIPVIMLTAKCELGDKLSGFVTGAARYLTKPYDMDELLNLVDTQLRQSKNTEKQITNRTEGATQYTLDGGESYAKLHSDN